MVNKVAIIFDNRARPETAGFYCRRALGEWVEIEHFLPSEIGRIRQDEFDLFLNVDDGMWYPVPADLHPSVWWAIDTHLGFERCLEKAKNFDLVFAAQRNGAERLREEGIVGAEWLPLACDPAIHCRRPCEGKRFDVCFVGNVFPGERARLLQLIQHRYPSAFVGRRYFADMADTYGRSRIAFNRSIRDDVNMRVFEALACGCLLVTNDLTGNGQAELFQDGVHLATYATDEELLEKIDDYLRDTEKRLRMAAAGHAEVVTRHTYSLRMRHILEAVETMLSKRSDRVVQRQTKYLAVAKPCARTDAGLTSIVIVTHNELNFTRQCLDSVRLRTDEPYEVVLVDNGSSDGTVEYLRALQSQGAVTLVENPENRGFPAAVNQGIRAARGGNIVLLNNDTIVTTGWLRRLLEALGADRGIGLVGPCSNNVSGQQQIAVNYRDLTGVDGFAWDWGKKHDGRRIDTDRLVGFCLLFRRDVVERIGLLDERFGIGCFEDDDFCRRAKSAGYRAVIAFDAFVHHFGSRTFLGSGVDFAGVLKENQKLYEAKWAASPALRPPQEFGPSGSVVGNPPRERGLAAVDDLATREKREAASGLPEHELTAAPGRGLPVARKDVRLSLCMIVRDNENTIAACLKSIRPWVDEMIVVDTGSEDRTPQIAQELGARLHHFPWCDDFAAARNESLKYAHGDWIFWMDSDDTIPDDCGRKLRALADGEHDARIFGYVMQVHCPGLDGDGQDDMTVVDHVKLFRNHVGLKFEGRIHEQILPAIRRAGGEVAFTDIFVVHSGSDHTPEGRKQKLERDVRLLALEQQENPDHPFVLFNLGMTHADCEEYREAILHLTRCIEVSRAEESHVRKAYALLVNAYAQCGQHDSSWETCRTGLMLFPDDKELRFRSGMLSHHFGRLEEAEHAYLRVLCDHEERHFTSVDAGISGYKGRHNLAIVYEEMGQLNKAEEQWRSAVEQKPSYKPAWHGLGEVLLKQCDYRGATDLVDQLRANWGLRAEAAILSARLRERQGDAIGARAELEAAASESPDHLEPLRELCRLLFERAPAEEAEKALKRLAEKDPRDASVHHNLGTTYVRLHRLDAAAAAYRRSLELRPNSANTWLQLRQCINSCSGTEKAVKVWQEGLGHVAENAELKAALEKANGS